MHPNDKTLVPTEALKWCRVSTKMILIEGDHVKGYFEDGADQQIPVVTEKIIGIPEKKNLVEEAFNDPRTYEQLQKAPRPPEELKFSDLGSGVAVVEQAAATAGFRLNEPLTSRLERGENLEDYLKMLSLDNLSSYPLGLDSMFTGAINSVLIAAQQKITGAITNLINKIPGASLFTPTIIRDFFTQPYVQKFTLKPNYTFPPSKVAPQYPYNQVYVSESGHINEYDDTPGAERIHTRHRSGTYEEYYPDGDHARRVRKDSHYIVDGCDTTIVRGTKQTVVEGSESVTVRGAKVLTVEGTCQILIMGDANVSVQGSMTQYVKGNMDQVIGGNFKQTVVGTYTQVVKDEYKATFEKDVSFRYEQEYKQNIKIQWTMKIDEQALLWDINGSPRSNRAINMGQVTLPQIAPETGDEDVLDGAEFVLEPTVTNSNAIETLADTCAKGDVSKFDVANAPFQLIKTIDISGKSIF